MHKERQNPGKLQGKPEKTLPKRRGRALDEEEQYKLFWLQKPRQSGHQEQNYSQIYCYRRLGARFPGIGGAFGWKEQGSGSARRQRVHRQKS